MGQDLMTNQLRKFVAPEIVFGVGALELSGRYAAQLGAKRVLVVTDPGVVRAGWAGRVMDSLAEAGVESIVFDEVTANPRSEQVQRGAHAFLEAECEAIVAVGGGSPIDCAKGIGIVVSNGGSVLDYAGVDHIRVPIPPLIAVPTTSGASADVSQFAIITDEAKRLKVAVISKAMVPDVALIDPMTLITMDRSLTACTVLDALTHAIEAYMSNGHSALTDLHALEAIRIISADFTNALEHLDDMELRTRMMLASLEAGLAFSNASLGAVHAMAHSLGGLLDLPHGHCNAILLPHVVAANYEATKDRFAALAAAMGVDPDSADLKNAVVDRISALVSSATVETSLSALGVEKHHLESLAHSACCDPCVLTNPRALSEEDILEIYTHAL